MYTFQKRHIFTQGTRVMKLHCSYDVTSVTWFETLHLYILLLHKWWHVYLQTSYPYTLLPQERHDLALYLCKTNDMTLETSHPCTLTNARLTGIWLEKYKTKTWHPHTPHCRTTQMNTHAGVNNLSVHKPCYQSCLHTILHIYYSYSLLLFRYTAGSYGPLMLLLYMLHIG